MNGWIAMITYLVGKAILMKFVSRSRDVFAGIDIPVLFSTTFPGPLNMPAGVAFQAQQHVSFHSEWQ